MQINLMQKNDRRNPEPEAEVLQWIKRANFVPFEVELIGNYADVVTADNAPIFLDYLFNERLRDYPGLIEYLKSEKVKREQRYADNRAEFDLEDISAEAAAHAVCHDLEEYARRRNLLKIMVEIAEAYNRHIEANIYREQEHEELKKIVGNLVEKLGGEMPEKFHAAKPRKFHLTAAPQFFIFSNTELPERQLGVRFFQSINNFMEAVSNEKDHSTEIILTGFGGLILKCDQRRFKKCIECHEIFWAKRLDSKCCSKPCSNIASQKAFQEKNREEINKRRRETYQSKKELKNGKERKKRNGNL
jgi:hypothetical protein